MDLGLEGKVAIITGDSAGIGLGVAEVFAKEGVDLVLAARKPQQLDTEAQRLASTYGVAAVPVETDVSTVAGCDRLARTAETAFGGADILINNAGVGSNETIMEAADDTWRYYFDLHVMAAVRLARGVVPSMKQRRGGAIVHNASIFAVQPLWYQPVYNVTQAALLMFSKDLANELIKDNIRVNTINPGLILTPDWVKTAKELSISSGGDWRGYLDGIANEHAPIKRFGTVEELASFFVFLCSDRASYSVGFPIRSMAGC